MLSKNCFIKAIFWGFYDTIVTKENNIIQDVINVIQDLHRQDIKIAILANEPSRHRIKEICSKYQLPIDLIVTPEYIRKKKPSPEFVYYACERLGVKPNQTIYIGSHPRTDLFCAHNAKIFFFTANWFLQKEDIEYALRLDTPQELISYLNIFFSKRYPWSWIVNDTRFGYPVKIRALMPYAQSADDSKIRELSKYAVQIKWGQHNVVQFFSLHLLTSLYLENIHDYKYWIIYPSSEPGKRNTLLNNIFEYIIRFFHSKEKFDNIDKIIVRLHKAEKSAYTRSQGKSVDFLNQTGTVGLDEEFASKIEKRTVLVIDDFTTEGFSFECARNLLFSVGAKDVICVAIGVSSRYPSSKKYYAQKICSHRNIVHEEKPFLMLKPSNNREECNAHYYPECVEDLYNSMLLFKKIQQHNLNSEPIF